MSGEDEVTESWAETVAAGEQANADVFIAELESRYIALKQEKEELEKERDKDRSVVSDLREQNRSLQDSLLAKESALAAAKRESLQLAEESKTKSVDDKAKQERMERMKAEGDDLREEISRLTESNKTLSAQVVEMETRSKLSAKSDVSLSFELERARKEIDSLSGHSKWLEGELEGRTEELAQEKRKHANQLSNVTQQLDAAVQERNELESSLAAMRQSGHTMGSKMERLSLELREAKEEAANIKETSQQELQEERRLIDLQKEQLDRLTLRYDRVVQENQSLRELANQASQTTQQEMDKVKLAIEEQAQKALSERESLHSRQVDLLKKQLEDSERRRTEAEEAFMTSPARPRQARPMLTQDSGEPLGLTEVYGRLAQTEDELAAKNTECRRLQLFLEKIKADVAAETPKIIRQRQEYDRMKGDQGELLERLAAARDELESTRQDLQESSSEQERLQRENREYQQETRDLAKQVQQLLISRSGGEPDADIPTTVQEIQAQNQQLLQERRRLSSQVEELQGKLQSDVLQKRLRDTEEENAYLVEERKKQETSVAAIVQQRDMYRALLSQHDTALADDSSDPVAAQSERNKELQLRNNELETSLAKAQADEKAATRDKEILEIRVARYETLTTELTSSNGTLQAELTSATAAVARKEADATYHRDKCVRLEETLQQTKNEVQRVNNILTQAHSVSSDLQTAVAAANAQASKCEQEVRQAEAKLRLAETREQIAKASEERLTREVTQLRNELVRQGDLIDSVQRIEASLTAKNEEELKRMTEKYQRLEQTLVSERSTHSLELESLNDRIREIELDLKSAESQKNEAAAAVLEAKKEGLASASTVQELKSKCSGLEAQLRSAKKKLGIEDLEADNVEVTLQAKVVTLTTDLEAARGELETAKERVARYQELAKRNDDALKELAKTTDEYKAAQKQEMESLKLQLENVKKESEAKQSMIVELTNDLASQRGEQDKAVAEIQGKFDNLEAETESLRKDAEVADSRMAALTAEMSSYRAEATMAQNKYERELSQHAEARTSLRNAREEADAEILLRRKAEEQLEVVNMQVEDERKLWEEQKNTLNGTIKDLEKSVEDSRAQNDILHRRLEALREDLEKIQSERMNAAAGAAAAVGATLIEDDADIEKLRNEISDHVATIGYMRKTLESSQAEVDRARRAEARAEAATKVTKRSLDEARAEANALKQRASSSVHDSKIENLKKKLEEEKRQCKLLTDSNTLAKEKESQLEAKIKSLESELASVKESVAPGEKKREALEVEKAALEAEKASLVRDLEAWKGRVHSLVSQCNQVDPEEHKKALKQVEDLTKECESLKTMKEAAERSTESAKTSIGRMNREISQLRTQVKASSSKATTEATKEREELLAKVKKMEANLESVRTELKGANQRNDAFKERLRGAKNFIAKRKEEAEQSKKEIQRLTAELAASKKKLASVQTTADRVTSPVPAARALSPAPAAAQAKEPEGMEEAKDSAVAKVQVQKPKPTPKEMPKEVPTKESTDSVPQSGEESKAPLRVPPEGFRFGPGGSMNPPASTGKRASTGVESKKDDVVAKKEAVSKPKPSAVATESLKRGAETKKEPLVSAAASKQAKKPKPSDGAVETQEPKDESSPGKAQAGAKATKAKTKAAPSDEPSAEDSLREKLLKRKRAAEAALEKAQRAPKRAVVAVKDAGGEEKPAAKEVASAEKSEEVSGDGEPSTSSKDEPAAVAAEKPDDSVGETSQIMPLAAAKKDENNVEISAGSDEAAAQPPAGDAPVPDVEADESPNDDSKMDEGESKKESSSESGPSAGETEKQAPSAAEETKSSVVEDTKETAAGESKESVAEESKEGADASKPEPPKTSVFGASSTFGSGAAFGGSTPFGQSSAPITFGTSPNLASASAKAAPTSDSGEKTTAFGGGGAFLDIKPPSGSSAPPFTFGASATIKLPTPSTGLPTAGLAFGSFGHGAGTPFGTSVAPQAHKPLFGAGTKREAPDEQDEEGESEAKQPKVEEAQEEEAQDEADGDDADNGDDDDDEEEIEVVEDEDDEDAEGEAAE